MLRQRSIYSAGLSSLLVLLAFIMPAAARDLWMAPEGAVCYQAPCVCDRRAPCAINRFVFSQLQPGDTMNLQPGQYPGFVFADVHGTAEQKIIIRGEAVSQVPAVYVRGDLANRQDAIEIARSSHVMIENMAVSNARRAGIRLNNSHHIGINNTLLRENGVWGIFTNHANHFTAQGNTIIGPAEQHGIYQSNSGDHVRITGNYIIDFDGCGLHFNGDLSMGGAQSVEGDGIISDVVISNNFIAGNGLRGGSAINLDGAKNVLIENNILLGNKASGIAVFKHDGANGSRNVRIR
jgi:parallel beta-helix repeat protein